MRESSIYVEAAAKGKRIEHRARESSIYVEVLMHRVQMAPVEAQGWVMGYLPIG